jgi:hypothetical protein
LRKHGIRTASDLVTAWRKDADAPAGGKGFSPHPLAHLLEPTPEGMPSRLAMIVDAIDDEEWIATFLNWHKRRGLDEKTMRLA